MSAARPTVLVRPGATFGVVAPATPAERRSDLSRGIEWWEAHGYRVRLGPSALERGRDFAGSPELRAGDLQEMFADPEIAAIQCLRGGYGSAEVVPLLDFDAIAGGRASGPVVGGCLPDLIHTFGTAWELTTDGAILFFEVQGYGPSWLDRHLVHLRQAGKLARVAGVVVGELPDSESGEGSAPTGRAGGRSTTSSRSGWDVSAFPCTTAFRSATGAAWRPSRSASRRLSTPTPSRSGSTARRSWREAPEGRGPA